MAGAYEVRPPFALAPLANAFLHGTTSDSRSLHPAHRLPLTAYRLPPTVYRLPPTAYRLPPTPRRSPIAGVCVQGVLRAQRPAGASGPAPSPSRVHQGPPAADAARADAGAPWPAWKLEMRQACGGTLTSRHTNSPARADAGTQSVGVGIRKCRLPGHLVIWSPGHLALNYPCPWPLHCCRALWTGRSMTPRAHHSRPPSRHCPRCPRCQRSSTRRRWTNGRARWRCVCYRPPSWSRCVPSSISTYTTWVNQSGSPI